MIDIPEFSERQIMMLLRYVLEKRARDRNKLLGEKNE